MEQETQTPFGQNITNPLASDAIPEPPAADTTLAERADEFEVASDIKTIHAFAHGTLILRKST